MRPPLAGFRPDWCLSWNLGLFNGVVSSCASSATPRVLKEDRGVHSFVHSLGDEVRLEAPMAHPAHPLCPFALTAPLL